MRTRAILFVILLASHLAGCAEVKPWQRGALARADMAAVPEPERTRLRAHVFDSREAAAGATAAGGGGCGCN